MDFYALARVFHVIGVVLWIGGVAMVTTVLLPAVSKMKTPEERVAFFESVEQKFAWQARWTTQITGLSGFAMLYFLDGWSRYQSLTYWWVIAMTFVWALFTIMLFVLEPLVLHQLFQRRAKVNPTGTFSLIQRIHWILLTLSLLTVAGAVAGSHGWFWV